MSGILDLATIDENSKIVHNHINRLVECTDIMRGIQNSLNAARESNQHHLLMEIRRLREDHEMMVQQLHEAGICSTSSSERKFKALKELIESDAWPIAIPEQNIPRTAQHWGKRADTIILLQIAENLEGAKFLDLGCGQGWTIEAASQQGAQAVGYDIEKLWKFNNSHNMTFTNERDKVISQGPYNVILIYDVLDHVQGDPIELLRFAQSLLAPRGHIYVRNHPWCGRHGGHAYTKLNKAYVHLFMDEVELMRAFGVATPFVKRLKNPLTAYRHWFQEAKLEIVTEIPVNAEVEPMFKKPDSPSIYEKLIGHWPDQDASIFLGIQFVDYTLKSLNSEDHII